MRREGENGVEGMESDDVRRRGKEWSRRSKEEREGVESNGARRREEWSKTTRVREGKKE